MGAASSFTADEVKNYTNKFIEGARDGNEEFVNQCLDKYPEVVNTIETYDNVITAWIIEFNIFILPQ